MKLSKNFVNGTPYLLSSQLVNLQYQLNLDRRLLGKFIYLSEYLPLIAGYRTSEAVVAVIVSCIIISKLLVSLILHICSDFSVCLSLFSVHMELIFLNASCDTLQVGNQLLF